MTTCLWRAADILHEAMMSKAGSNDGHFGLPTEGQRTFGLTTASPHSIQIDSLTPRGTCQMHAHPHTVRMAQIHHISISAVSRLIDLDTVGCITQSQLVFG